MGERGEGEVFARWRGGERWRGSLRGVNAVREGGEDCQFNKTVPREAMKNERSNILIVFQSSLFLELEFQESGSRKSNVFCWVEATLRTTSFSTKAVEAPTRYVMPSRTAT